ncbi:unnamed protein product [Bursaphelenchus xylophilus]|uniref:(pine wood nematode) hypothetical protein n=1 Tax=Bursaphelenchus xylophilus TaxID=6326 RepID=A0A1I7RKX4_BURXY|nr:unnamed protein product [Bursaphelenchus xylophilus]CAG9083750.1 unnamed protein product [Bursaphelenchus xylophilus]
MPQPGLLLWLFLVIPVVLASCPPGCTCHDDNKDVVCSNVNLGSIPMFLNPELKRLLLIDCSITEPDAMTLRIYEDLEELDLSGNNISRLENEALDQLQNLRILRLNRNRLTDLDQTLFARLIKLETLDLSQNFIKAVPSQLLVRLQSLRHLNLSRNSLLDLDSMVFAGLDHVRSLDLSFNKLQKISPSLFLDLAQLETLDLGHNQFEKISYGVFSSQSQLLSLELPWNKLRNMEMGAFTGLRKLRSLDLSSNKLTAAPREQWPYVAALEELSISDNPMNALDSLDFLELSALRSLTATHMNDLVRINDDSFHGLCALEKLTITGCRQLHLISPTAISNCSRLRILNLSGNGISSWMVGTLDLSRLAVVDLSDNPWFCNCSWTPTLRNLISSHNSPNMARCDGPEQMAGLGLDKAVLGCQNTLLTLARQNLNNLPVLGLLVGSLLLVTILVVTVSLKLLCCTKKEKNVQKNGRMPLYGGSSSFSGSIIYDKPESISDLMDNTIGNMNTGTCQRYVSALPQGRPDLMNYPATDYYSSLVLLPNNCHNCAYNTSNYASPYATNAACFPHSLSRSRLRPPSFIAPPPPPSCPPPPLSSYHRNGVPL